MFVHDVFLFFLTEYTNSLRTAAAAAASAAANPTSNSSYVGITRIGTAVTSQPANTPATTGTSSSSIFQKFSSTEVKLNAYLFFLLGALNSLQLRRPVEECTLYVVILLVYYILHAIGSQKRLC